MRKVTAITSAVAGLLLGALGLPQAAQAQTAEGCAASGTIQIICGDSAAEDLVSIPGTNWVLASAFTNTGGLRLIDGRTRQVTSFSFGSNIGEKMDRRTFTACPGSLSDTDKAKFITHGLALGPKRGKVQTVYAVHHGSRESVEIFALNTSRKTPSLTWKGCIVAPDRVGLNSIVSLPDGGLIGTNFMPRGGDQAAAFQGVLAGKQNGELWEWNSGKGWKKVPASEGSGLNGVEVSRDGSTLYVAAWGSKSFTRMARDGGSHGRMTIPLGFRVDNLRWRRDGQLILAGQTEGGSKVVAIHPQSMKVTELAQFADSPSFHGASGAIQLADEIWIGSYGSPNIAIVKAGEN